MLEYTLRSDAVHSSFQIQLLNSVIYAASRGTETSNTFAFGHLWTLSRILVVALGPSCLHSIPWWAEAH